MRLVLASASARRADLLRAARLPFEVSHASIDEVRRPDEPAHEYVRRMAIEKVRTISASRPDAIVLGADTIVTIDDQILGKPGTPSQATSMLALLAARDHLVLTGIALSADGHSRLETDVVQTRVWMSPLSHAELETYVRTGEPLDKAGAYAIQGIGSRFIERIEGSYSNVVGLPVGAVYRLLKRLGVPVEAIVSAASAHS